MKTAQAWRLRMKDMQILHAPRQRSHLKKPTWIIILVSLVSIFLICAYIYPPQNSAACYVFSSNGCKAFSNWLPPAPTREHTDEEIASRVVIRDILNTPTIESKNPKIAFMFLSQGTLPFEKLWDKFFHGHDGRFSVYVHASNERPVHSSRHFMNSDIRSDKVVWGKISMVDAERRLLANALKDPDNQHFVLLSDSCIPLRNFDFVYNYLMYTNISFIDSFVDPGPHGNGRYTEHMLPEVEKKDFRKGSQWFTMKRKHALIVMADNLYYSKFRDYCKPGMDGRINCYSDEHYLPTFFQMFDPAGIANWSITHVDWSERKWHPKSYRAQDVTNELMKNITCSIMTLESEGTWERAAMMDTSRAIACVLVIELEFSWLCFWPLGNGL
ncbi:glycosyltransferase BC10-like isoform X2 [Cornus florida]|uniref:glycosyltransferase BC10-like isoform X2 n=1 Tax=Cornus florida TaxID=4283 RepID=UPI00289DE314|nr:glycosyltransferase BC10-like isoform X2 [Cornus florida]